MTRTAVVTDGEERAALATVRSLGAAGWRILVCSSSARSLAGGSRYATGEVRVPSSLRAPTEFARAVRDIVSEERADLVMPITEQALLAILPERDALAPARIPFPDDAHFRRISNKALLLDAARDLGIEIPDQCVLASRELLAGIEPSLRFPLVVKPSRSVGEAGGHREKLRVKHAANRDELRAAIRGFSDAAFPVLLQQRVIGPGVGIFLLRWDGATRAQFSHRRLREKPPSGGVSVYRESIAADPQLVMRSAALLERFDWYGPAMVEYKIDRTSGLAYLMEINGRFWGSLQLAIDAGVDFPALLAQLAMGERPAPVLTYTTGVRSRWWWGDVDQLLLRLRRSPDALALPPDAPSRLRAVAEFLTLWRPGDRNEILRLDDPGPALRETMAWFNGR